ncbi:MAG: phosphoheptose isomerase [Ferruginibacter sp.]|nr:phosphoheptose isomerase [Ferruginibacter sp.]
MQLVLEEGLQKAEVFDKVRSYISASIRISNMDDNRPWGGFFVIEEEDASVFIEKFFPHLHIDELQISGKLSPKILLVAPGKRLSWQYHFRRAEIWKLIAGEAAVVTSDDDEEKQTRNLFPGDIVELRQGERHRLIGLESWGIVAEIWRHTERANPSDEDDIIRLQDDFGR